MVVVAVSLTIPQTELLLMVINFTIKVPDESNV